MDSIGQIWIDVKRTVRTPRLKTKLIALYAEAELIDFPDNFNSLCELITETPTWFVASSENDDSLISCELALSCPGLSFTAYDKTTSFEVLIILGDAFPPLCDHVYDIRPFLFSIEQKLLLAIQGLHGIAQTGKGLRLVDDMSFDIVWMTAYD